MKAYGTSKKWPSLWLLMPYFYFRFPRIFLLFSFSMIILQGFSSRKNEWHQSLLGQDRSFFSSGTRQRREGPKILGGNNLKKLNKLYMGGPLMLVHFHPRKNSPKSEQESAPTPGGVHAMSSRPARTAWPVHGRACSPWLSTATD